MKLDKEEKDFLVEILKEEAKKQVWEDIQNFNISHAMVLKGYPGKQSWEIEGFQQIRKKVEIMIKKYNIDRRKIAKRLLKKFAKGRKHDG